jgi:hypothetical protein
MKKTAALLEPKTAKKIYRIRLTLQERQTAEFVYSDRMMARSHYDQLQGTGIVGGYAIKSYSFEEETIDDTETK